MTNYEKIKTLEKEDLAHFLCNAIHNCSGCFAKNLCYYGHNGMISWLESEVDEDAVD